MNNGVSKSVGQSQVLTRSLMRNVYIWMSLGLAITGVVAYGASRNEFLLSALSSSGAFMILFIVQIGLVSISAHVS